MRKIGIILILLMLLLPGALAFETDGTKDWINNTEAYVEAPSQAYAPGYIEYKITNKNITGNYTIGLFFYEEYTKPLTILINKSWTEEIYDDMNNQTVNYTHEYNYANSPISKNIISYNNMNRLWTVPNEYLEQDETYSIKVYLTAPPQKEGMTFEEAYPDYSNKYGIGLWPGEYGNDYEAAGSHATILDPEINITNGLYASYSFDSDATDDYDSHDLSVFGATHTTTEYGIGPGAYLFDGVNDYMVGDNWGGTDAISVVAIIKPDTVTGNAHTVISKKNNAGSVFWIFRQYNDELDFGRYNGVWAHCISNNVNLVPNKTYCAAATVNFGAVKLYINGTETAYGTCQLLGPLPSINNSFVVGAVGNPTTGYSDYYSGMMDEVRIYDKILNSTEIDYTCNNKLSSPTPPSGGQEKKDDFLEITSHIIFVLLLLLLAIIIILEKTTGQKFGDIYIFKVITVTTAILILVQLIVYLML